MAQVDVSTTSDLSPEAAWKLASDLGRFGDWMTIFGGWRGNVPASIDKGTRVSSLIKVKGFQVAPAELEALLLKHPQIADVAVIPVADPDGGEVPKAIIVPKEANGTLTAEVVKAFLGGMVAHYKRIHHVEFIDAIPKSTAGKILRRVLVERERARR